MKQAKLLVIIIRFHGLNYGVYTNHEKVSATKMHSMTFHPTLIDSDNTWLCLT